MATIRNNKAAFLPGQNETGRAYKTTRARAYAGSISAGACGGGPHPVSRVAYGATGFPEYGIRGADSRDSGNLSRLPSPGPRDRATGIPEFVEWFPDSGTRPQGKRGGAVASMVHIATQEFPIEMPWVRKPPVRPRRPGTPEPLEAGNNLPGGACGGCGVNPLIYIGYWNLRT